MAVLGVDLGGTKLATALFDAQQELPQSLAFEAIITQGAESVVEVDVALI